MRLLPILMLLPALLLPGCSGVRAASAPDGATGRPEMIKGGPCAYDDFPGTATFTTVGPEPELGPGIAARFRFVPDGPVDSPLFHADKEYLYTLPGGRLPQKEQAEQLGLQPGHREPCLLRTITRGTCTPVLFVFPDLHP